MIEIGPQLADTLRLGMHLAGAALALVAWKWKGRRSG